MFELYYTMCFDGNDEEKSNFYHCVALAENEKDFKNIVHSKAELTLSKIYTVTDYLKESGYKKEIIDLSKQVDDYNPIVFSKPIAFFSNQQAGENAVDPNQAVDNDIVSVNIDYQDRDGFMKEAKAWLLRQAGYVQEDPRFSSIYTIIDQEAAEKSILLIDAAQFHPYLSFHRTQDHMVCLFDGQQAQEMETVAPYLLESQHLVDFIRDLHDESYSVMGGDNPEPYTALKEMKGIMLLKTDNSLDQVRKHLRRFTQIKTVDGYDEHGSPINESWVYFRFTEQLSVQEWLKNSEPEVSSHFMKPFDEILFARCDSCSLHRIVKNEDKIIENPKYPNLNGGLLLTERQSNAFKLGKKEYIIGEAQVFLYRHYADLLKARGRNRQHVQTYLYRMWDNFHKAGGETRRGYRQSIMAGLYLGVDYMFDPLKRHFYHGQLELEADDHIDWDFQHSMLDRLEEMPLDLWSYIHNEDKLNLIVNILLPVCVK